MSDKVYNMKPGFCDKSLFGAVQSGPKASEDFYSKWTSEVKKRVPSDRLLVYSVEESWSPLCEFLGLPVPSSEFPALGSESDTDMVRMSDNAGVVGWAILLLSPLIATFIVFKLFSRWGIIDEDEFFG